MFEVINITSEFAVEFTSSLPPWSYDKDKEYFKVEHQI